MGLVVAAVLEGAGLVSVRSQDFLASMGMKDVTTFRQREFVERECVKLMQTPIMEETHNFLQDNEGSDLMDQLVENYPGEIINPGVMHRRFGGGSRGFEGPVDVRVGSQQVQLVDGGQHQGAVRERVEYTTKMDKEANKIHTAWEKEKPEEGIEGDRRQRGRDRNS
jgi:hypothetical protein